MAKESLAPILRRIEIATGVSFQPSSFDRRLRIQKSIYFLKALGFNPVSDYAFGAYVRGPYSPQLAHDYYALPAGGILNASPFEVPPKCLAPVVEAVRGGNDFLEAAATLRIYREHNPTSAKREVFEYVSLLKPELAQRLEEGWAFLEKHRLLPGRT